MSESRVVTGSFFVADLGTIQNTKSISVWVLGLETDSGYTVSQCRAIPCVRVVHGVYWLDRNEKLCIQSLATEELLNTMLLSKVSLITQYLQVISSQ
jgi:hypothetical protein